MNLRPSVLTRVLAALAVGAAMLASGAPAATGNTATTPRTVAGYEASSTPGLMPGALDDVETIPGLTVSIVGDVPASATPQSTYSTMVRAVSSRRALTDARIAVSVTNAPFESSADLASFLEDPASASVHQAAAVPLGAVDPMGRGTLSLGDESAALVAVPPGALGLDPAQGGVYGVVIELRAGTSVAWREVVPLTWQPRSLPALDVSVLATISGNPDRVTALLTAASDERVALAVDPSALTLPQRLALSGREAYALPAGNLDITSAAHASANGLVTSSLEAGRAGLELPWLAIAAAADDATVAAASTEGAFAIVADPRWTSVETSSPTVTVTGIPDVVSSPLVVPDPALSAALAGRSPSDPTLAARVYAEGAFAAMRGAGSVVISPGDVWLVDGSRPSRAIDDLLDAPFVTPRTLAAQLSGPERPEVDLVDVEPSPADIPNESLVGAASALSSLATLDAASGGASVMIADARGGVYSSLSVSNRSDPVRRHEAIAAALEVAAGVSRSVFVTSGSDVLLVSRSGAVPITIHNGLDAPVSVRVAMTSRSPILQSQDQPIAQIEANTDATVTVPVEAVSSGDVSVSVALRTEDGATVAVAETLKVRVRAAWGSAATGVVTAALVVLFIAGIVRTIRRGRRDTRLVPTASTPVAGATDADA